MGFIGYITEDNQADYSFGDLGDYVFHNAIHNAEGLYVIQSGSHNEKNFSIGQNCIGDYASENHNADGSLKYVYGNNGDNYSGPIGNKIWFFYPDTNAVVSDDGSGNALITSSNHSLAEGFYIMVKGYEFYGHIPTNKYSGYYYVDDVTTHTFKLRTQSGGDYLEYNAVYDSSIVYSMTIGASKLEGIDAHGSAANPVVITNAPGSQAIFRKNPTSSQNYGFQLFNGATHVKLTGRYDQHQRTGDVNYQGHLGGYKFRYGKYGFVFQFYNTNTNNSILQVADGASDWEVEHIEIDGGTRGFAGIMFKTDGEPTLNMSNIHIHDCYIHDMDGEGCYIGNTSSNTPGSSPTQHWVQLFMYNNRYARAGVEILQTGQLKDTSVIENNVAFLGSLTHMAPFFIGQSNAQQLLPRSGEVINRNNIVIGSTVNGLFCRSNRANEALDASKSLRVENCVYHHGRFRFLYYDCPSDGVMPLRFKNIYLKNIKPYDTGRNESQPDNNNEIVYTTDNVSEFFLNNVVVDSGMDSRDLISGGIESHFNFTSVQRSQDVPDVEFVNSGYEGLNYLDIHIWFSNFNDTHPTNPSALIAYTTDDIVLYLGNHYKCVNNHQSSTVPSASSNWEQIFWDENGYHSLHDDYNGTPYSTKPPDDFRLVANSFYNKQGIGLFDNESNSDSTFIEWEYCYSTTGETYNLPVQRTAEISLSEVQRKIGTGNYVRRKVTPVNQYGIGVTSTSDWIQI